ncbi:MAG: hypothetical protein R3B82_13840 [Sandaracinaceae bacterium]
MGRDARRGRVGLGEGLHVTGHRLLEAREAAGLGDARRGCVGLGEGLHVTGHRLFEVRQAADHRVDRGVRVLLLDLRHELRDRQLARLRHPGRLLPRRLDELVLAELDLHRHLVAVAIGRRRDLRVGDRGRDLVEGERAHGLRRLRRGLGLVLRQDDVVESEVREGELDLDRVRHLLELRELAPIGRGCHHAHRVQREGDPLAGPELDQLLVVRERARQVAGREEPAALEEPLLVVVRPGLFLQELERLHDLGGLGEARIELLERARGVERRLEVTLPDRAAQRVGEHLSSLLRITHG